MHITRRVVGDAAVLALTGDLNRATAEEVSRALDLTVPETGAMVLDLSDVPYLCSSGLRVLLLLHRRARMRRQRLALVGVPDETRDLLSTTGFLDAFLVAESVAGAVADLTGHRELEGSRA
jgi:anti-sigma B factor antagonist